MFDSVLQSTRGVNLLKKIILMAAKKHLSVLLKSAEPPQVTHGFKTESHCPTYNLRIHGFILTKNSLNTWKI